MKINLKREKLFDNPGYIKLSDYVDDIFDMQKNGNWKLPLRFIDKVQLYTAKYFLLFSWMKESIYIEYPYIWSPAYNVLVNYLKRNSILGGIFRVNSVLNYEGYLLYGGNKTNLKGGGVSVLSKEEAFSKSVGELIERSISGIYNEDTYSINGSYNKLRITNKNILYPPKYHRYLRAQKDKFEDVNTSEDTDFEWVYGTNIISKEKVLIPKHLAFWNSNNKIRNSKQKFLQQPTTNGSAGFFDMDTAVLRGVLEVVQRDGFLCYWLTKIAPKIINGSDLEQEAKIKIERIKEFGVDVFILDIMTDIHIPSVCVVVRTNNEIKRVLVCAASDLTYQKSVDAALDEIAQCMSTLVKSEYSHEDYKGDFIPFLSSLDRDSRINIYTGDVWMERFNWFVSGESIAYLEVKNKDLSNDKENQSISLEKIKNILEGLGEAYNPYVYIPKSKITKDLGFYVAQVFIPICFPLYLTERFGTFDSERLRIFFEYMGCKRWSIEKINKWPHMFP